jgi:hypothetical protein
METSYKINDSLYLVRRYVYGKETIPGVSSTPPPSQPTNHILAIDCSGSMAGDLPRIREQLKSKLPLLLKEDDTVSIVWFSGRSQYGTLLQAEKVAGLTDLQRVNQAIDRWLRPVGMTGFKEPLEEVGKIILKMRAFDSNPIALWFMSDGCDNEWNRLDILKAANHVGIDCSSATIVEYGYYADRPLLTSMAEQMGGSVIFAEDFNRYEPQFEAQLSKGISGVPKVTIQFIGDIVRNLVWSLKDGEILTYAPDEEGEILVPADTGTLWYLSPVPVGENTFNNSATTTWGNSAPVDALYAAISLFAQRMSSNVVYSLLKVSGDVRFIKAYTNCFGKQAYSDFVELGKRAAFDPDFQLTDGYNPTYLPAEDAFTVLDLLRVLASDEDNHVLLDSKEFVYNKISRDRVDANEVLTAEEQEELNKLTEELKVRQSIIRLKEINARIGELTNKQAPLKFVLTKNEKGYPISSLTYNEDRPNISIQVRKEGTVDLQNRIAETGKNCPLLWNFPTHIYRNYAIIKDGLLNVEKLPVRLSAGTIKALKKAGMPIECVEGLEGVPNDKIRARITKAGKEQFISCVLNLKSLPILNRKMVKEVSAEELFQTQWNLLKVQASLKVLKSYVPKRESEGFEEQYGKEAATWLKEQGITSYGGFAPKVVQAESKDFYTGKELLVHLKGFSSLPTLNDVLGRIVKNKLTPAASLMVPALREYEKQIGGDLESPVTRPVVQDWLKGRVEELTKLSRELLAHIAQIKFAIIVGQTWPKEFTSLDQDTLTFKAEFEGKELDVEGRLEMKEVKILL